MTDKQIRQNAADYVYNFQPTGVITEDRLKCYIAGTQSRNIDEMFESLDPYKKAEFMQRNMEWARNCDLVNELKIRGL